MTKPEDIPFDRFLALCAELPPYLLHTVDWHEENLRLVLSKANEKLPIEEREDRTDKEVKELQEDIAKIKELGIPERPVCGKKKADGGDYCHRCLSRNYGGPCFRQDEWHDVARYISLVRMSLEELRRLEHERMK